MIRDYKEFAEFKNDLKVQRGHFCQRCGRTDNLRVYFECEEARNTLDPSRAVLLCGRCFDVAISVNRILTAQKSFHSRNDI